jgi:hypothetical protein
MIMSMSIKSKALFGFGLTALVSAAGARPASAYTEFFPGPSVPGVSGPVTNGTFADIRTNSTTVNLLYLGYSASDTDTLTLAPSTTPIFTNNSTALGSTASLTVPLGVLPLTLNNLNNPILGPRSYESGKPYLNLVNLSTTEPAFFPTYHFADFSVSSETDFNDLFGPKVTMTTAENTYILGHGGYASWLFVGVEDLPWKGTDDWNDFVFAASGLNTTILIGTPEPSTWAMMLIGFAGLGYAAHRSAKRRRSALA